MGISHFSESNFHVRCLLLSVSLWAHALISLSAGDWCARLFADLHPLLQKYCYRHCYKYCYNQERTFAIESKLPPLAFDGGAANCFSSDTQRWRNLKRDDRTWMMTRNIQTWNDIIWSIASKVSWFVRSQPSRVQWTLIICISGFTAAAEDFKWHFCLFGVHLWCNC